MPTFTANMTKDQKAYLAVGEFMFHFAGLEFQLNLFLRSLLHLGLLEAHIITSNIDVRTKVYIIQTAIDMRPIKDDVLLAKAKADLKSVVSIAENRNILAHHHFSPMDDGVDFYRVKAKGKLSLPDTKWTYEQFNRFYYEMGRLTQAIIALDKAIVKHPATELLTAMTESLGNMNPQLRPAIAELIAMSVKGKENEEAAGNEEPATKE